MILVIIVYNNNLCRYDNDYSCDKCFRTSLSPWSWWVDVQCRWWPSTVVYKQDKSSPSTGPVGGQKFSAYAFGWFRLLAQFMFHFYEVLAVMTFANGELLRFIQSIPDFSESILIKIIIKNIFSCSQFNEYHPTSDDDHFLYHFEAQFGETKNTSLFH